MKNDTAAGLDLRGTTGHEILHVQERTFDRHIQFKDRIRYKLMLEHADIAKAYLHGRIGIIVTLNMTVAGNIVEDPGNSELVYFRLKKLSSVGITVWKCDFYFSDFGKGNDWGEDSVLIENIKAIQAIKQTSFATFKSFNPSKEFLCIGSGCFYSLTDGFIAGLRPSEREGCVSVLCTAIMPHQFPHGMIERRSKIMDAISDHEGDIGGISGVRIADVGIDELGARIGIFANNKSCLIALSKSPESRLDIRGVRIGPVTLEEGTFKHSESYNEEEAEN